MRVSASSNAFIVLFVAAMLMLMERLSKRVKQCIHLCIRIHTFISIVNRFSTVLVWCIHYSSNACVSEALVLASTLVIE